MLRTLIALLVLSLASPAFSERRVALVIGNSDYAHASKLPNPQNDAKAIGVKLNGLGFEVFLHENLGGQEFRVALGDFAEEALRSDLAVVFYAGHGIEMGGSNYLIPIDAKMSSEATAEFEAVSLDRILSTVRNAGKLGLVMLDACRDNPFSNKMKRKNGKRAVSRGLAPITLEGEAGTLVSFAAQAGDTADDGEGENSPYTEALLELLAEPGLEVGALFQRVTKVVKDKTGGRQKPMFRIQPPEDLVYLVPQGAVVPKQTSPSSAPTVPTENPLVAYLDAVQSGERAPLETFIARYPTHAKAPDAKQLLLNIADREFWETTKKKNTISAYDTYIVAFSDGSFVQDAKSRKKALELAEKQLAAVQAPKPKPAPAPKPQSNGIRTWCTALNRGASVQNIRTNDTLFVRSGRGTNYHVVGELPYNANGVELGTCKSGWCQITYGCISGYSFGKYLKNGTGGQAASRYAGVYHVVNHPLDQKLNVRAGPDTTYKIVAELPPQATGVRVTDCQVQGKYSMRWCTVQWQNISGWAYGRYLADASGRSPKR